MKPEEIASDPLKPPTPATWSLTHPPQATTTSPWLDYLTGKKMPARRLIARVEAARRQGGIILPDVEMKDRFAEALVAKPDRTARLVSLLQAAGACSDTVRRIVIEFAEVALKRLGIVSFPEPLDAEGFRVTVTRWLAGVGKKPVRLTELQILFLLLQFGWHRQLLDPATAYSLLTAAVSKPSKNRPKQAATPGPRLTSLEVLLSAPPSFQVLSVLVAHAQAVEAERDALNSQIRLQATELAQLVADRESLNAAITGLRAVLSTHKNEQAIAEAKVAELESQIVDIRDGYQHKLDDLRGRVRGTLRGPLRRWLETALDASRSDPPWNQAIQERLEDALKLIEKESQWLQPLG